MIVDGDAVRALVDRLKQKHPMEYAFKGRLMIIHTEAVTGPLHDRTSRCPVCEEWSPCDVRRAADLLEQIVLAES